MRRLFHMLKPLIEKYNTVCFNHPTLVFAYRQLEHAHFAMKH